MTKMLPTKKDVDTPSTGHKLRCTNHPWKLGNKLTLGGKGGPKQNWGAGRRICCLNDHRNVSCAENCRDLAKNHDKNSPFVVLPFFARLFCSIPLNSIKSWLPLGQCQEESRPLPGFSAISSWLETWQSAADLLSPACGEAAREALRDLSEWDRRYALAKLGCIG